MEIFKTNYIGMVDKLVNQAKELEREAKLSNAEWIAEQWYNKEEAIADKDNWCAKQLILK